MNNYFLLNINYDGKSAVDDWIDKKKIAPIFYGHSTIDSIRSSTGHGLKHQAFHDARLFVDTFSESGRDSDVILSIGDKDIYFYKKASPLKENLEYNEKDTNVKYIGVKIIKKLSIKESPLILVSIKSNRYLSSGTFKQLTKEKNFGNICAADYCFHGKRIEIGSFENYLKCLSSLEFETLIAKILEETGLFVPAYKGGFIKNFDLFCKNYERSNIEICNHTIQPNGSISIQIKLSLERKHLITESDLYFCIDSRIVDKKVIDAGQIQKLLMQCPKTTLWLERTLSWVDFNDRGDG